MRICAVNVSVIDSPMIRPSVNRIRALSRNASSWSITSSGAGSTVSDHITHRRCSQVKSAIMPVSIMRRYGKRVRRLCSAAALSSPPSSALVARNSNSDPGRKLERAFGL